MSVSAELMMASEPEKKVYYTLVKLGESFDFQSQMLGYHGEKGSTRADFVLPQHRLILRVQGEYWHSFPETKARDQLQKIALTTQGWTVIDLMESDIMRDAGYYVEEALKGFDHSREI